MGAWGRRRVSHMYDRFVCSAPWYQRRFLGSFTPETQAVPLTNYSFLSHSSYSCSPLMSQVPTSRLLGQVHIPVVQVLDLAFHLSYGGGWGSCLAWAKAVALNEGMAQQLSQTLSVNRNSEREELMAHGLCDPSTHICSQKQKTNKICPHQFSKFRYLCLQQFISTFIPETTVAECHIHRTVSHSFLFRNASHLVLIPLRKCLPGLPVLLGHESQRQEGYNCQSGRAWHPTGWV